MAIAQTLTGLHIRKRIRAAFSPATTAKQLNELKMKACTDLLALEYLLGGDETIPLKLVNFYQLVSPWCDRSAKLYQLERDLARIDYGQYKKACQALVAIAAQEERDPYGVNRTVPMQVPTSATTFVSSTWTHSVEWWEQNRKILVREPYVIGDSCSPTVMEVVDAKASKLLNDGIDRWTLFLQDLIDS